MTPENCSEPLAGDEDQRAKGQAAWLEVVEAVGDHARQIDELVHQDMQYNDHINLVADHCQILTKDTDYNLRAQLDKFAEDLSTSIGALDSKQGKLIGDAKNKFDAFELDAQKLMEATDRKIIQIEGYLAEHRLQNSEPRAE